MKKLTGLLTALLLTIASITQVNAATAGAGACGTMTYGISRSGNNASVHTSVSAPKSHSFVRTKTSVKVNSTGAHVYAGTVTSAYGGRSAVYNYTNNTPTILAVFGTHEVAGGANVVRYTSATF